MFPKVWDEINNLLECQIISTFKYQILATLLNKCKLVCFVFFMQERAALEKPTIFGHINFFLLLRFLERLKEKTRKSEEYCYRIKAVGLVGLYYNPINLNILIWSCRKKFMMKKSVSVRNC